MKSKWSARFLLSLAYAPLFQLVNTFQVPFFVIFSSTGTNRNETFSLHFCRCLGEIDFNRVAREEFICTLHNGTDQRVVLWQVEREAGNGEKRFIPNHYPPNILQWITVRTWFEESSLSHSKQMGLQWVRAYFVAIISLKAFRKWEIDFSLLRREPLSLAFFALWLWIFYVYVEFGTIKGKKAKEKDEGGSHLMNKLEFRYVFMML